MGTVAVAVGETVPVAVAVVVGEAVPVAVAVLVAVVVVVGVGVPVALAVPVVTTVGVGAVPLALSAAIPGMTARRGKLDGEPCWLNTGVRLAMPTTASATAATAVRILELCRTVPPMVQLGRIIHAYATYEAIHSGMGLE